MKTLITIVLALMCAIFAPHALAQQVSPGAVAGECARQMLAGVCRVKPDRTQALPGETLLIGGVGAVSMQAYLDYALLFNEADPQDTSMCELALTKMLAEPGGDHDRLARAYWTPVNAEPQKTPSPSLAPSPASMPAALTLLAVAAGLQVLTWPIASRRQRRADVCTPTR